MKFRIKITSQKLQVKVKAGHEEHEAGHEGHEEKPEKSAKKQLESVQSAELQDEILKER